jgi:hypothetical protein
MLDTSQTLQQCLVEKTIIEFPTLYVVLPDNIDSYPIHVNHSITKIKTG